MLGANRHNKTANWPRQHSLSHSESCNVYLRGAGAFLRRVFGPSIYTPRLVEGGGVLRAAGGQGSTADYSAVS